MADVKISELPARAVQATDLVPAVDAAGTVTSKVTAQSIAQLGGGPPASHVHGNITNAGAIGTTANLPVITGASGVLQAGAFGTTANTFCQGNDSRLSDARTAVSHESSHRSTGADAIQLVIPTTLSLTTSVNDWTPNGGDGDIIKFSCSTALNITGLSASMKAKAILLVNSGAANTATIKHQQSSTAANRFITPDGLDYAIAAGQSAAVWYDPEASRWRVVG